MTGDYTCPRCGGPSHFNDALGIVPCPHAYPLQFTVYNQLEYENLKTKLTILKEAVIKARSWDAKSCVCGSCQALDKALKDIGEE